MRSAQALKEGAGAPTSPKSSKDATDGGSIQATALIANADAAKGSMQALLSGAFSDPVAVRAQNKYTLAQLVASKASGDPEKWLTDVDPTKKEQYLSDTDFASAFEGMSRTDFEKLAKWKRDKLKKTAGLF